MASAPARVAIPEMSGIEVLRVGSSAEMAEFIIDPRVEIPDVGAGGVPMLREGGFPEISTA